MSAKRSILPLFVPHLGCEYRCVFCNQRSITGETAGCTPEKVREAICSAADEGLISPETGCELAFYGGSFTAIPAREAEELLRAASPFLNSGLISSIRVSTRPDVVSNERLSMLKRYGVETIELGTQSMSDEVLRKSGRGHTASDTGMAAELIKSTGFNLILQMMTGLPGDSREISLESAQKIAALSPDGVRIYPAVVLRGTELHRMWERGEYEEHSVEQAVELCSDIFGIFIKAGIPVIRIGLNPSEELGGGQVVAGAYHPALGELVRSRMFYKAAAELLYGCAPGSDVIFGVSKRNISQAAGQKRENIHKLVEAFKLGSLRVVPAEIPEGKIVILSVANA